MSTKSISMKSLLCATLLAVAFPQCLCAADFIKVQFVQRPPFTSQAANGAVEGLLATPVEQIFNRAGIGMQWELTSVNRQWDAITNPKEMTCSVGWFKNPEREKIAKYTKPIFQDQPHVILARKQISFDPNDKLEKLLASTTTRLLLKNKYSYGIKLDGLFKKYQSKTVMSDAEYRQMVQLLIADRADIMFVTREEAQYLFENEDISKDLQILSPKDMPEGEKRYLVCNRLVSDELIDRLNRAITF
jgi:uncharacterized protein (TIGR02285 family)